MHARSKIGGMEEGRGGAIAATMKVGETSDQQQTRVRTRDSRV